MTVRFESANVFRTASSRHASLRICFISASAWCTTFNQMFYICRGRKNFLCLFFALM